MKDEIIIYQANQASTRIEVKIEDETVWLTQAQMVQLFNSTKQNISLHINNIFKENELVYNSTVKENLTVQKEGLRIVRRKQTFYNLDIIISVGYRVKSKQGTQFRIWANQILKDYLLKGQITNYRINSLESEMSLVKIKLNEIDIQLQTNLPSKQGIFFNGQIFDVYVFFTEIIKKAQNEIILIDNYIDETVLTQLSKRNKNVSATIFTGNISQQLKLDLEKHNKQYPPIEIKQFADTHDRFLIIDRSELYHLGASLKDLGKKWFAFSRMDSFTEILLNKLTIV
jgi:hypothetical protein